VYHPALHIYQRNVVHCNVRRRKRQNDRRLVCASNKYWPAIASRAEYSTALPFQIKGKAEMSAAALVSVSVAGVRPVDVAEMVMIPGDFSIDE